MARVLLTGGGTGAANSLIRDLRAGDPDIFVVACGIDRFALKKSSADRNYLVDPADHPAHLHELRRVLSDERIDLIIPTSDDDIQMLGRSRDSLSSRVFLPSTETVQLCQDKYDLLCRLRARGVPAPVSIPVASLAEIDRAFDALPGSPLWCRVRAGAGSSAAAPVASPE
jgi:carbamoylphosphate synthase large subunit